MIRKFALTLVFLLLPLTSYGAGEFTIARLKYSGGGDWYNDPSSIPNMLRELGQRTNVKVAKDQVVVELSSKELYSYPFLYMTGHGRISLSDQEAKRLRSYLIHGGFLYADDDYGMDKYFRQEIKKVFPDKVLVELPFGHSIYHCHYDLPHGLPKIHQHDEKPPQGFGIFYEGRLVVFYTYETNISDGWADAEVHHDPPDKREQAFKVGVNIIVYALSH